MNKINYDEMIHLFGEKVVQEYAHTDTNRLYTMTKNYKNRYTLYSKSIYAGEYGHNYSTVATGKKKIQEYIKKNELIKIIK